MKKFVKVIKIILLSLAVLILGGFMVLYIVNHELASQILDKVVEYANKPLPVVGVSVAAGCVLVWKIFSYSLYGKKTLAQLRSENEAYKSKLRQEYEEKKKEYAAVLSCYEKENDLVYNAVSKICEVSPNKKLNEIGKNLSTSVANIREELRTRFNQISVSDIDILNKSKEEIIQSVVEEVKKNLEEKYGKESKEVIDSISEAKKI